MGKVKFTASVAEIRNKVGGNVYSRNRYGSYTRDYVVPTNPNTSYQATIRAAFGTLSAAWKTLTNEQRALWSQAASALKKVDIFGNQYSSVGFSYYMQINTELNLVGSSTVTEPPQLTPIPKIGEVTAEYDPVSGKFTFDMGANDLTTDQAIVVRMSACLSQGLTFFKNLVYIVVVLPDSTAFPADVSAEYAMKYMGFTINTRVGWSLYIVDKVTGLRSAPLNGYTDIVP